MPYCPEDDESDGKVYYNSETVREKVVAEYTGLNMIQVNDICIFDFDSLLRDAIIYRNNQSKAGREYLEKCWYLEQTKPERNKLRDKFGRGMK